MDIIRIVLIIVVILAFLFEAIGGSGPWMTYDHRWGKGHGYLTGHGQRWGSCYKPLLDATLAFVIMTCIVLFVAFVLILLALLRGCVSAIPAIPQEGLITLVLVIVSFVFCLIGWAVAVGAFTKSCYGAPYSDIDWYSLGWGTILQIVACVFIIVAAVLSFLGMKGGPAKVEANA